MSLLHRLLQIDMAPIARDRVRHDAEMQRKSETLTEARQELRQNLQKVHSGASVFETTAGAMRIIRNARESL